MMESHHCTTPNEALSPQGTSPSGKRQTEKHIRDEVDSHVWSTGQPSHHTDTERSRPDVPPDGMSGMLSAHIHSHSNLNLMRLST